MKCGLKTKTTHPILAPMATVGFCNSFLQKKKKSCCHSKRNWEGNKERVIERKKRNTNLNDTEFEITALELAHYYIHSAFLFALAKGPLQSLFKNNCTHGSCISLFSFTLLFCYSFAHSFGFVFSIHMRKRMKCRSCNLQIGVLSLLGCVFQFCGDSSGGGKWWREFLEHM